jgi:ankyrin repeat protein
LITASGNRSLSIHPGYRKKSKIREAARANKWHHFLMTSSRRQLLNLGGTMFASSLVASASTDTPYARDHSGRSAFLVACLEGRDAEKESLRKRGLVLDLHEAAAAGDTARVEAILVRNPGSVNHRDLQDATPIHYAAACGQIAVANILLMKGADLGAIAAGLGDATPAHFASSIADSKTAALMLGTLVGNGAPPGARKTDGTTPLHVAAHHGHAEAVRLLVRRGADATFADGAGQTPAQVATGEAAAALAESIPRDCQTARFRGVQRNDTYGLPQAWINGFVTAAHFDLDKVKRLYAQCPDLLLTRSTWDEIGVEAAAHMGREDMATFFLDKGSPVSLCTACMLGFTDEVKKLLAEDANRVHERGAHDFPALWYTAFGVERPDFLELLLASGADIHAGMMGNTIVQLAEKKKYNRLLEIVNARRP